jgi:hypothetical protein
VTQVTILSKIDLSLLLIAYLVHQDTTALHRLPKQMAQTPELFCVMKEITALEIQTPDSPALRDIIVQKVLLNPYPALVDTTAIKLV